jgi:hypothetical protein
MITEPVDPAIADARVQLARAARKLVLRIFEVSPVTSHQSWDHILYLARLARDLERANSGLSGPESGPHSEWYTIPLKYIERAGKLGDDVDPDLPEKVIRESHPFPAGV